MKAKIMLHLKLEIIDVTGTKNNALKNVITIRCVTLRR